MEEIFKPVDGYTNYHISNHGTLRRTTRSGFKYFKGSPSSGYTHTQYAKMNLSANGKNKTVMAHRLVAEAFIPNPENLPVVNHKDLNPANNHVSNLEWCTYQYNAEHGLGKPIELISATSEKLVFPSLTKAAEFLGCLPASIHYYANESVPSPSGYVVRYAGGNVYAE